MSPLRLFQQTLRSAHKLNLLSAPNLNGGEKLLASTLSTAGLNLNQSRGTVNDHNKQQHVEPQPYERNEGINTRESLLGKIRDSQKKFRIVSLPNVITTSRLLMAPAMGYFIMNGMQSQALACCAYVVVSDVADKVIAKMTKQSSPLNFTLDAIADKLFLSTSVIALHKMDLVSIYFVKSVVIKDLIQLAGAATIRYQSFEERPSLRQYLDVNNYPSMIFRTNTFNQVNTGLLYMMIMASLKFGHLDGDPVYDWSMFAGQGVLIAFSSIILAWAITTFVEPRFFSFLRRP